MTVHPLLRQAMASAVVRRYPMSLVVLVAVIDGGLTTETAQAVKITALAHTLRLPDAKSVRRGLSWLVRCGYLVQDTPARTRHPGVYRLADRGHDSPYRARRPLPPLEDAA